VRANPLAGDDERDVAVARAVELRAREEVGAERRGRHDDRGRGR
jgi:hypothetical protein